jgi:beta-lactamase class C
MPIRAVRFPILALLFLVGLLSGADTRSEAEVKQAIDLAIKPLLEKHGIPGIAVGVTIDGKRYFVEYGLASRSPQLKITRDTLFELGSISKTFTATLAARAEVDGKLSLNDPIGQHLPELKASPLGSVRLLELATHTAGGFPLQLPDELKTQADLMSYFRQWKPQFPPGVQRHYANPSIGLLGVVVAKALATHLHQSPSHSHAHLRLGP